MNHLTTSDTDSIECPLCGKVNHRVLDEPILREWVPDCTFTFSRPCGHCAAWLYYWVCLSARFARMEVRPFVEAFPESWSARQRKLAEE